MLCPQFWPSTLGQYDLGKHRFRDHFFTFLQNSSWQKIWPIFGATNQLIAAVALFVTATWLMAVKKPTGYALYPALFMVVTTIGALGWQGYRFLTAPEPNFFLGGMALVLIGLAIFVGNEGIQSLRGRRVAGAIPAAENARA